jgi:N-acetylmuramoyl-L-alanine amidase
MKSAVLLLLLAAFAPASGAAPAAGATSGAETVSIGGKEYVRLNDWARANDFEARWLKRDETLQLSSHSAKLLLQIDSRQAEFNKVAVWLSFPVADRNGAVYLALLDARTTLQPLLSPPKNRPGVAIRTICLDPGHGGKDPGFCVGSRQEKKYTLLLAEELRQQLIRAGLKVALTRSRDTFVELSARPDLARRRAADLFVSLHFNSAGSFPGAVQGAEVYCLTPAGAPSTNAQGEGGGAGASAGNRFNDRNVFLAFQIQRALGQSLGSEDRGVKRARYEVLRYATMPAILIEGGFMSHPDEGRKIFSASYRRQMARAIVEGLLAFKRTVEQ